MDYRIGTYIATASTNDGILGSLGIDLTSFIIQTASFLVLLAILYKFVYPPLMKAIDTRDANLAKAANAAREAQRQIDEAQEQAASMVRRARSEAAAIVAESREEATTLIEEATEKATRKSAALIDSAKTDIAREVAAARETLRKEAVDLVATATGAVLSEKVTSAKDTELIKRAIKEAQ
ncbi:MAG: F0F1 ATP synthase subunit B [Candidatus Saccharibacteria bacterium]|nr:F0F1 ATP synthase subunit B [Candidatus Saccharibacteria bacterium]